ncbi:MAG: YidB family protein [Pseudomonadota bacterium]
MGLLDSMLGSVLGGQSGAQAAPGGEALAQVLGGLLSGSGSGGAGGGLGGLVEQFQRAGLGEVIGSWIGTGRNLPVSAEQIGQVLGSDTVAQIAQRLGVDPAQAAGQLSHLLPEVIDRLTPNGQLPAQAGAGAPDLLGMLGGLLRK